MASSFQKKTSRIFLTVFVGFIAISFMFTGYETSMGTPDTVARVGDIQIRIQDYQNEYNRQLEFYREMTGQSLSSQQIESFGIRQSAIQGLVQRSLMVQFARELGVNPGDQAIRDEIMELPYFQAGGRFDMERYRQLLASNGMTPAEFEEMIEKQLQSEMAMNLLQATPISHRYIKKREEFKNQQFQVSMLELQPTALREHIEVTSHEIEEFLSDEINQNQVRELFENRRTQLDQQEEALASHILLTESEEYPTSEEARAKLEEIKSQASAQNFAELANQYTQDPSGAGEGGSLGWFGRGQMVPEFEEVAFSHEVGAIVGPIETQFGQHLLYIEDKKEAVPANFEDHEESLAKELIRSHKTEELQSLVSEVKRDVQQAFETSDQARVKRLQEQYGLQYETKISFNRLSGAENVGMFMRPRDIQRIFIENEKTAKDFFLFEDGSRSLFVKIDERIEPEESEISFEQEKNALRGILAQKMQESILEVMEERHNVRVWENRVF